MTDTFDIAAAAAGTGNCAPLSFEEMIRQGWVYREPQASFSPEMWDFFLSLLGDGNYHVIATQEGEGWKHGQLFISPNGLKQIQELSEVSETVN
jgi:hypothetical protein